LEYTSEFNLAIRINNAKITLTIPKKIIAEESILPSIFLEYANKNAPRPVNTIPKNNAEMLNLF
jgi:hypothetical protein